MWKIDEILWLAILFVLSVTDIRKRQVSVTLIIFVGVMTLLYQLFLGEIHLTVMLGGIAVGALFLLLAKITEEQIGYGDGWLILVLGLFLGFWGILTVLCIAFFSLLVVLIPLLSSKKMSRKCAVPFLPFLTFGYLLFIVLGGVKC